MPDSQTATYVPDAYDQFEADMQREKERYRARRRRTDPCPTTAPFLHIACGKPGQHVLTFKHIESPQYVDRPFGAESLELYVVKSEHHGAPFEDAELVGEFKRRVMRVEFDREDDGLVATYYGRWKHRSGQKGPWSVPISFRIAV